ncbi:hypothetical protein Salat_2564800 [Sesamum alatum]|uniref:Uncharacterized protein n=1 Tax=Sesamum alatum TaxID=300844 RepID=A0AAE2CCU4_9LAMI|nr:hypothetical protein Salat_2564800 [Sesamum alatum]
MEEDLLIVAGLHPVENTYSDLESHYSRLLLRIHFPPRVRNQPRPLPRTFSEWTRSFSFGDPLEHTSKLFFSQPFPFSDVDVLWGPWAPYRDRSPDKVVHEGELASSPAFLALMATPQFNPEATVSNMLITVHRADVNYLAGRPVEGLGPTALVPYYYDPRHYSCHETRYREELRILKGQLEDKNRVLTMQSIEIDSLKNLTFKSYTKGREEGLAKGQSSAVAAFKASLEYIKEVFRQGTSFADGFTVCAEQCKNLGNHPPDFDYNFLDMRADGYGRIGV